MRAAMSLALDVEPQSAAAAHDAPAAEAVAAVNSDVDGEWETVGKRSGGGGLVTQVISRSRYHAAAQQNLSVTFFNESRQHASRSNLFGLVSNICAPPGAWMTLKSVCVVYV